jgi:hypothetical protein
LKDFISKVTLQYVVQECNVNLKFSSFATLSGDNNMIAGLAKAKQVVYINVTYIPKGWPKPFGIQHIFNKIEKGWPKPKLSEHVLLLIKKNI